VLSTGNIITLESQNIPCQMTVGWLLRIWCAKHDSFIRIKRFQALSRVDLTFLYVSRLISEIIAGGILGVRRDSLWAPLSINSQYSARYPPKNGEITLVLATNRGCVVKYVSQKSHDAVWAPQSTNSQYCARYYMWCIKRLLSRIIAGGIPAWPNQSFVIPYRQLDFR